MLSLYRRQHKAPNCVLTSRLSKSASSKDFCFIFVILTMNTARLKFSYSFNMVNIILVKIQGGWDWRHRPCSIQRTFPNESEIALFEIRPRQLGVFSNCAYQFFTYNLVKIETCNLARSRPAAPDISFFDDVTYRQIAVGDDAGSCEEINSFFRSGSLFFVVKCHVDFFLNDQ